MAAGGKPLLTVVQPLGAGQKYIVIFIGSYSKVPDKE